MIELFKITWTIVAESITTKPHYIDSEEEHLIKELISNTLLAAGLRLKSFAVGEKKNE